MLWRMLEISLIAVSLRRYHTAVDLGSWESSGDLGQIKDQAIATKARVHFNIRRFLFRKSCIWKNMTRQHSFFDRKLGDHGN